MSLLQYTIRKFENGLKTVKLLHIANIKYVDTKDCSLHIRRKFSVTISACIMDIVFKVFLKVKRFCEMLTC